MNSPTYLIAIFILVTHVTQNDGEDLCERQTTSTCILLPQATEGPYYWNATYNRQNITENSTGIPFTLKITVIEVESCKPIPRAAIDIWHCDATGIYSHFVNASLVPGNGPPPGANGTRPPGPPGGGSPITDNTTFLRGLQVTNDDGVATFYTIYPGWYTGRATHIHVKVHINGTYTDSNGVYTGGHVAHTGQLFFNDTFTDGVARLEPYLSHNITRVLNNLDGIFNDQENGALQEGVNASIVLSINSSATPVLIQGGGGSSPTSTLSSKGITDVMTDFGLILFHFVIFCSL